MQFMVDNKDAVENRFQELLGLLKSPEVSKKDQKELLNNKKGE
jgi:hypothetical protein